MSAYLSVFALLLILIIYLAPVNANPGGAGVGVLNVKPTFSYIHFSSADGVHMIEVNVSDYNSWEDIYKVTLTFTADDGPITVISYTQYSNRSDMSSRVDWFNESYGNYLIRDRTNITYRVFSGGAEERCCLNITFTFRPIEALKVVVVAEDLSGAVAVSRVDYPPLFGGIPMEQEPVSTDLIALVLSIFGTAGAIKVKYGSFMRPMKNLRNGIKEVRKR